MNRAAAHYDERLRLEVMLDGRDELIRISPEVDLELVYRDDFCSDWDDGVDCRLLFLGDHFGQLKKAYEEVVGIFETTPDPAELLQGLRASAVIQGLYEIGCDDGQVSVAMRDPVFRKPGSVERLKFRLKISHAGVGEFWEVPFERFVALGNLLPLLLGKHCEDQIKSRLEQRLSPEQAGWASESFNWLKSRQYLVYGGFDEAGTSPHGDLPRVTFMGHSSILLQSEKSAVLTDPIVLKKLGSPRVAFEILGLDFGAVCCSHAHWDHCNLQTLLWIDKRTPILIPRVERPSAFNPPIAPVLGHLGFTDIREVELWSSYRIEDIEVVPIPFYGEQDEPGAEIDHYTYVLKTAALTVYGGVDCFRDSRGEMGPVLERVRRLYGPAVAFLPVSRMVYRYKWGGVNGFCHYLNRDLLERSFQYTAAPHEASQWSQLLRAKYVVPYAAFIFSPWTCPVETVEFGTALRKQGIAHHFYPLRPLDSLGPADLKHGLRRAIRRRLLVQWMRGLQKLHYFKRRLKQVLRPLRFIRRRFSAAR